MVTRFGFREVWADGDRLLLNGQQLMPWGDHSIPYVHERQWLTRKLVDLADGNISIVEHPRYAAPPVLYDVGGRRRRRGDRHGGGEGGRARAGA